jgi:hypothetical protein
MELTPAPTVHRCSVCGRVITSPESIARQTGSTCWEHTGGSVARNRAQRKRNKIKAKLMQNQMDEDEQLKFKF